MNSILHELVCSVLRRARVQVKNNPNSESSCGCGSSFSAKSWNFQSLRCNRFLRFFQLFILTWSCSPSGHHSVHSWCLFDAIHRHSRHVFLERRTILLAIPALLATAHFRLRLLHELLQCTPPTSGFATWPLYCIVLRFFLFFLIVWFYLHLEFWFCVTQP